MTTVNNLESLMLAGECAACGGTVELANGGRVKIHCAHAGRVVAGFTCEVEQGLAELGIRIVDGMLKRDS